MVRTTGIIAEYMFTSSSFTHNIHKVSEIYCAVVIFVVGGDVFTRQTERSYRSSRSSRS